MRLVIQVPDNDDAADDMMMMLGIVSGEIGKGFTSGKIGEMVWNLQEAGA